MQTIPVRSMRLAALLSLLLLGCDRVPTRPEKDALHLTLWVSSRSGDSTHPIRLGAQIRNVGRRAVTYAEGCQANDFRLVVRDPERRRIEVPCQECPIPCPTCLGVLIIALAPGESVVEEVTFSGTLVGCAGPFQGSSGTYTAEAIFDAWSAENQRVSVSKVATFDWSAQASD